MSSRTRRPARWTIDHNAPPVWEPLKRVAALTVHHPGLLEIKVRDFMYMGRLVSERGHVHLYKHVGSRRYLNLDEAGHAYRVQTFVGGIVAVAPFRSLCEVLTAPVLPNR